jgi:hypothetical protein
MTARSAYSVLRERIAVSSLQAARPRELKI